jgi:hypothetical protein
VQKCPPTLKRFRKPAPYLRTPIRATCELPASRQAAIATCNSQAFASPDQTAAPRQAKAQGQQEGMAAVGRGITSNWPREKSKHGPHTERQSTPGSARSASSPHTKIVFPASRSGAAEPRSHSQSLSLERARPPIARAAPASTAPSRPSFVASALPSPHAF